MAPPPSTAASEIDIDERIENLDILLHFSKYHQPAPAVSNEPTKRLLGPSPCNADLAGGTVPEIRQEPNKAWMGRIPDDSPLNLLSIPGTHDSCARSKLIYVQTQTQSVTEQLSAGVRALDLRLRRQRSSGQLFCYHGGVPLGPFGKPLPLSSVMAEVWLFMRSTGFTETVVVSIDNDDPAEGRSADGRREFYDAVVDFISQTPRWGKGEGGEVGGRSDEQRSSRWYVDHITPTLGQVRGKAVLLRRFATEHGHHKSPYAVLGGVNKNDDPETIEEIGFDLSAWINNSPDFVLRTPHADFRIQDRWKYSERISLVDLIESKSDHVRSLMAQAVCQEQNARLLGTNSSRDTWFIHFTSAVGEPYKHGEIATAKSIAVGAFVGWGKWQPGVNIAIAQFINRYGTGQRHRLGVVFMDFAALPEDAGLLDSIIQTNFEDTRNNVVVLGV